MGDEGAVELGRRVRAARRARGMNQRDLATKAEISRDSLVKLERAQRTTRPATLKKVARALGMEFEDLVEAGTYSQAAAAVVASKPPPGYATIRLVGASLRDVLDEAIEAYERSYDRMDRAEKLRGGVMDAETALASVGTRRKPHGVPRERAAKLAPGDGLSDAVLEERAAQADAAASAR